MESKQLSKGKIVFINFQQIYDCFCKNSFVNYIYNDVKVHNSHSCFITSFIDKKEDRIIGHGKMSHIIYRGISFLSRKLSIPYHIERTLQELFIDSLHARFVFKMSKADILVTTFYTPLSVMIARSRGIKTIFLTGNMCDELYYRAVTNEQHRLNIKYTDVYSSPFRLSVYKRMLSNIDMVYCANRAMRDSFNGYNAKLLPLTLYKKQNYTPKVYTKREFGNLTIGYIGHTTLLKGVHLLAEAIYRSEKRDNIKLVIVGNVDINIQKIIDNFQLNVEYRGFIDNEIKQDVIKEFDYMAVPSLYDAGPTTILEALECNVPVIVSSGCGGCDYIADASNCFVYETGNIDSLTALVNKIYAEQESLLTDNSLNTLPILKNKNKSLVEKIIEDEIYS